MYRITKTTGAILAAAVLLFAFAIAYAEENDDRGQGQSGNRGMGIGLTVSSEVSASVQALQDQIKKLREQIDELLKKQREAMQELRTSRGTDDNDFADDSDDSNRGQSISKAVKDRLTFLRSLSRGMSGDDVRDLQELLAEDRDVYPEGLITGFFGSLTEKALKKFQGKHGIETVGIFGPQTRARLLLLFEGRALPPGIAKRLGLEGSTTTPGVGVVTVCHKPVGTSPQTIVIGIPALRAHLAHGDTLGLCPGGTSTTTPPTDTTAPTISGISVSSIASTSASVMWTTNENATGKIYYGTSTPVDLLSALSMSNTTLTMAHQFLLSGLFASTTYHYVLESKDAAGNTATTSTSSFVTVN